MNYKESLSKCGISIPEVLLPQKGIDLDKWAVVACDQFSSDSKYWESVKTHTGDQSSTLNLILPECYLDESDVRVPEINRNMKTYLDNGILESIGNGFIYLERSTPWVDNRKGLMVSLDLEAYSYEEGARCQIRPTEGTVLERLPVRAEIRKNAVLDIPHILVLLDDPDNTLFSFLDSRKKDLETVYDFDLADNAGHLNGSLVSDPEDLETLAGIFSELNRRNDFLFAVGDGNHSLGAAKQLWNKIKDETGNMDHPARYALVELENIHDPGVNFEPIHRVLFDCPFNSFMPDFKAFDGTDAVPVDSWEDLKQKVDDFDRNGEFALGMSCSSGYFLLTLQNKSASLASEAFHTFLDPWLKKGLCSEIDYIHGEKVLKELSETNENMGFYLPSVNKNTFFDLISKRGPMPRKTFSIGEAEEKRYYLECRKLVP